ncbi:MAG TPA: DUF72 domain-containing protein [Steroidobacteraceae bacterium]|nr:DUF72 domain-containing protein [Steroidobacteraceae bacterium]
MARKKSGTIYVGVGGWNFAPWRGTYYPKGVTQAKELHYSSRQLTSIEINSTFYGLQKPATFQKWHDETPDAFVFSVKAPRFVMLRKNLADAAVAPALERFLDSGLANLGTKLGPINWQFDPSKKFDAAEVGAFLERLPRKLEGRALRHALEVRHESFDCEEFVGLARKHEVAVVEAGDSEYPRLQARTAPFSYLRVMGTKASSPNGYAPSALAKWRDHAEKLAAEGDVFFYFISGAKERNPLAARALLAEMGTVPVC